MASFKPGWLPFGLGSLPQSDPQTAWGVILDHFEAIPGWPQLPQRAYLENMYVQFSQRFPGVVVQDERLYVDRRKGLDEGLEQLYLAYLEGDLSYGRISVDYAMGLHLLRQGRVALPVEMLALQGQLIGPISWGLTVVDQNQRPILYDEVLADAVGKHLRLKAAWQEQELAALAPGTVMIVDEPYMASFGSTFVSLSREQVIGLLEEVFAGLAGAKGIHCSGNIDWSVLLATSLDILCVDAYDYTETLALYPKDVASFLERGGIIAWGIVPASVSAETETVESLVDRLHQAIDHLVAKGISLDAILEAGMVTPSRGLGALSAGLAVRVCDLTVGVAQEMQHRYVSAEDARGDKVTPPEESDEPAQ